MNMYLMIIKAYHSFVIEGLKSHFLISVEARLFIVFRWPGWELNFI